jgi:hypothetical protein
MSKPPVLLLSLFLSTAALAEQPLSTPALRAATGEQRSVALAASPTDALAVWEDDRAANTILHPGADIYATRIGLDGLPSGDGGVPITPDTRPDYAPAVVWTGSDYLVAHVLAGAFDDRGGIRLTRVTLDGPVQERLLGGAEYDPSSSITSSSLVMATNGSVELLIIGPAFPTGSGGGAKPGIFGLLVDRDLHMVRAAFPIASDVDPHAASVASDGRDFLVTWRQLDASRSLLRNAVVRADGTVGPASTLAALAPAVPSPSPIVWNGSKYLVVSSDEMVRAQFVAQDGTPAGPTIDLHAGATPAAAWNGGEYLIVFAVPGDRTDLYAVRLDAGGHLLDSTPRAISASPGAQTAPAVTSLGGQFLVAWTDVDTIRSSIVAPSGEPGPQSLVAESLGAQSLPAPGVFDGRNLGFAWSEEGHVLFGRSTLNGTLLDGPGIDLGTGAAPKIAFNGSEYLVAWSYAPPLANTATRAMRIAPDGTLLDPAPLEIPVLTQMIATNGSDFLLAEFALGSFNLRPTIVTAGGEVHVQPDPTGNSDGEILLSLDWTGTHYLAVYQHLFGPPCGRICDPKFETRSLLLDATGLASGLSNFIAPSDRTISLGYSGAFGDGIEAIAVPSNPIRLLRLDRQGVYLGQSSIPCPGSCRVTQVVWTGSDFAIATDTGVQHAGADGTVHGGPFLFPQGIFLSRIIQAGRALAYTYTRLVPIEPAVPNGLVMRAFFDWVSIARRRAVH